MVVAKLESYERIPIFRDVKTFIASFLLNPGTTEELTNHLQTEYQDKNSFNFALYCAIKYLQEAIAEHRHKSLKINLNRLTHGKVYLLNCRKAT
jgi:hypothetical protein